MSHHPDEPYESRYAGHGYTNREGTLSTNRDRDGRFTAPPEAWPSDAVLPAEVQAASDAYYGAAGDLDDANAELRRLTHASEKARRERQHEAEMTDAAMAEDEKRLATLAKLDVEIALRTDIAKARARVQTAKEAAGAARRELLRLLNDPGTVAAIVAAADAHADEASRRFAAAVDTFEREHAAWLSVLESQQNARVHIADEHGVWRWPHTKYAPSHDLLPGKPQSPTLQDVLATMRGQLGAVIRDAEQREAAE